MTGNARTASRRVKQLLVLGFATGLLAACGGAAGASTGATTGSTTTVTTTVNITNVVQSVGSDVPSVETATVTSAKLDPTGALTAAYALAVALTTYDYQTLDSQFAAVLDRATDNFRAEYTKASQSLRDLILKFKATATGKVLEAGLVDFDGKKATVLLFVDQTVRNQKSDQPRVDRSRMRMGLVNVNGGWQISALDLL